MIHIPEISEENQGSMFMTRKQVMTLFQISKSTLYRWVHKEKRLPYTKTNRTIRFKKDDVQRMIEQNYVSK
jgi:excisionase family DNA binding protein